MMKGMMRCATLLWVMGMTMDMLHCQYFQSYQIDTIRVDVGEPVDLESPDFPRCCYKFDVYYRVQCIVEHKLEPSCSLRVNFTDVDLTPGSFIKVYENVVLVADISQRRGSWGSWPHRVVTSSSDTLYMHVYTVPSRGTRQHTGFKAHIQKSLFPQVIGQHQTNCPAAVRRLYGQLTLPFINYAHQGYDCIWVLRGYKNCHLFIASPNDTASSVLYEVRAGSSRGSHIRFPTRRGHYLLYTSHSALYLRVRNTNSIHTQEVNIYYGCHTSIYTSTAPQPGGVLLPQPWAWLLPTPCSSPEISLSGGFECRAYSRCIPGGATCNGVAECEDGSDEWSTLCSAPWLRPQHDTGGSAPHLRTRNDTTPTVAYSILHAQTSRHMRTFRPQTRTHPTRSTPIISSSPLTSTIGGYHSHERPTYAGLYITYAAAPVISILMAFCLCFYASKKRARQVGVLEEELPTIVEQELAVSMVPSPLYPKPTSHLPQANLPSYEEIFPPDYPPPQYSESPTEGATASTASPGHHQQEVHAVATRGQHLRNHPEGIVLVEGSGEGSGTQIIPLWMSGLINQAAENSDEERLVI